MSTKKIFWYSLSFLILTLIGFYYLFYVGNIEVQYLLKIRNLDYSFWIIILILMPVVYVVEALRFYVFARVVDYRLGYFVCLQAAIINFTFSWITPGSTMGAPASSVFFKSKNIPWDMSVLLAFGKSLSGMAFYLVIALPFLIYFYFSKDNQGLVLQLTLLGIIIFAIPFVIAVITSFKAFNVQGDQESERDSAAKEDVRKSKFKRYWAGAIQFFRQVMIKLSVIHQNKYRNLVMLFVVHFCYFFLLVSICSLVLFQLGSQSASENGYLSLVYLTINMYAITPGGAGISEIAAADVFSPPLTLENTILVALIFRSVIFYFQIIVGYVYLLFKWLLLFKKVSD
ncbi:hypothetical protein MNBD_GAMMA12-1974 [hydrothermal vent metagenome]|uniref:Flippase-like domain-containing protein n=1 Tax=hydrothermal vent metagenome TaxID=652676 RepID=A0A3B0Z132_9ZZZZ